MTKSKIKSKITIKNVLKKLQNFKIKPKVEKSGTIIYLHFPIKEIIENSIFKKKEREQLVEYTKRHEEYENDVVLKLYKNDKKNIIIAYDSDEDIKRHVDFDLYCCNKIESIENKSLYLHFRMMYETIFAYKIGSANSYFGTILDWFVDAKYWIKKEGWDNI